MEDFTLESVGISRRIVPAHDVTIVRTPQSPEGHDHVVNIHPMRRSGGPFIEPLVVVLEMVPEIPLAEHARIVVR
jgi:hypothetical protein